MNKRVHVVPNRPVVIDRFSDLPGVAEIIGHGGVRAPFGEAQEVEVAVLLACNMDAPEFNSVRDARVRWVGCGQLDLLAAGSRWRRGAPAGYVPMERVSAAFELVRDERIGEGLVPHPDGFRPFPSRPIATSAGFLLRRVPEQINGKLEHSAGWKPELILLPQMELLRGLFGVSGPFLIELFDGIRNSAVLGERGLINRRHSRLQDDGTVILAASRNLSRDEALIAAAVVSDPQLRRLHDFVFQHLSVNSNWRGGRPIDLNLPWPWQMPIRLGIDGRWIARAGGGRRFLAMRLVSIGMSLPFSRIEVHHPGGEAGDRSGLPPPEGRLRSKNARIMVLTTGRAASPSRRPAEIETGSVELPNSAGVEIVSVARGGIARIDRSGIGEDPRDEGPFGTGGRQPGADAQVGLAVTRRMGAGRSDTSMLDPVLRPERDLAQALDLTWRALSTACMRAGWRLDALPMRDTVVTGAPHGGLDLRKEPLVARVSAGTRRALIVDVGSPTGDERSLGVLVPRNAALSDRALAALARKAATSVNGRWRSPTLYSWDFRVTAVNRSAEVWKNVDAYASMLRRRIASALGI